MSSPLELTSSTTFTDRIADFAALDESAKELIKAATHARQYAYNPYSQFKVGAAFRSKCGKIYTGCNVENAAFTPTSCAERTALSKAVSEGIRQFVAGAVVAYQKDTFTSPCGVCRQFMMEFANVDIPIYLAKDKNDAEQPSVNDDEKVLCTSVYNLLPYGFRTYIQS